MSRNDRAREKADKRAIRILRRWQRGESYADLARSLGLSRERVRVIVARGKSVKPDAFTKAHNKRKVV